MPTIRPAKIKDVPAIAKLNMELMKHVGKYDKIFKLRPGALAKMEAWRRKGVYSSRSKLLVAEDGNKIVGYMAASIKKRPSIYEVREVGAISDAYVLPAYRRQGIAKKFVEQVFEWLKKKGMTHVHLYAVTKNEVAVEVWKKFGFKEFLKEKYCRL